MDWAVAIRAHEDTPDLRAMVQTWGDSLGHHRVFVLFDATKTPPPPLPRVLVYTEDACRQANPFHVSNWHNSEYPIALLQSIGATYVWMIESDVGCDGDIGLCIQKCTSTADFMAFQVRGYSEGNRGWEWWPSIKGELAAVPMQDRMACFFPVTRYSAAMLRAVAEHMGRSSGHCEAYIPTLAAASGLRVEQLPLSMHGHVGFRIFRQLPGKWDHRLYHKYLPGPLGLYAHRHWLTVLAILSAVVALIGLHVLWKQ
jgi:hypothetical protein